MDLIGLKGSDEEGLQGSLDKEEETVSRSEDVPKQELLADELAASQRDDRTEGDTAQGHTTDPTVDVSNDT